MIDAVGAQALVNVLVQHQVEVVVLGQQVRALRDVAVDRVVPRLVNAETVGREGLRATAGAQRGGTAVARTLDFSMRAFLVAQPLGSTVSQYALAFRTVCVCVCGGS